MPVNKKDIEFMKDIFIEAYCYNGFHIGNAYNTALQSVGKPALSLASASSIGGKYMKDEYVMDKIDEVKVKIQLKIEEDFKLERQKIVENMWRTYEKAMEEQQSFDRNGKPIAKYDVNSITGANKSLELLAKTVGLLIDKVETKQENNHIVNGVIEVEVV